MDKNVSLRNMLRDFVSIKPYLRGKYTNASFDRAVIYMGKVDCRLRSIVPTIGVGSGGEGPQFQSETSLRNRVTFEVDYGFCEGEITTETIPCNVYEYIVLCVCKREREREREREKERENGEKREAERETK
ncbi:hypothetical protein EGW08_021043 [Elysia chlorotica]|uniref:Uncharacterized protein n=1 Tax=Elysia chlorotica TaxID=188477 RepID=A0A3S0ZMZ2_ELYCH|nr:hypothetical protein EGW08_021043 [Elysia chlorotica]